ncbi:MAG: glycosyltransferase [Microcystis panniformis Mp_MB_F_20051200_S9]|uniref:Glycosyltransferase n=1 Tax=Microcystis panniformis Mp_MB_F_20051200_S9 TaxID=2486223 RepID=A0A552PSM1_9CHRO|nr:MAG: glycosyltransferase [Microcystis panniformis Mp_MB_F_20080800_S26D]TRV48334.1 MAG: glycosyltransferase [Microcystis panniformis Mp_GB_SS_20050300_S99D]TRV50591.1 MAG: glycosyltransferase [Microcystis panniformis Mp_GB_SS_20050300_S99]TRV55848.1 MAG: glycosyltransferase [Microcystis panniformis Mp_MB_F_20080800_S26]TRV59666.1 MAG: glycosyltransferase [Microcystis panniformis Mp_MB_F_20051200_S9D]TRV59921.1 MAG: glycosyltransferase [Microcystis panniformis Mp_MB_F_20051200_S9]TRV71956.1
MVIMIIFKVKKLLKKFVFSLQEEGWKSALKKTKRKIIKILTGKSSSEFEEQVLESAKLAEPRPLEIASSDDPLVSIIIPVYNQFAYTFNCLESLTVNLSSDLAYEIIIVNDASTDETLEQLDTLVKGIKVLTNAENSGFIRSCNYGASQAKGQYLYFLNNDTRILENCLESLLKLIVNNPQVGAVGSKLIYANSKQQEAGGIIWNSADGWNYGRLDSPEEPEYNYVRPVDYCSGASLLVPADLFKQLGGFCQDFIPAYYEDTDLCFAIRELGYQVLYQPQSNVIHYEGITSGTDLSSGIKQYQVINQTKFREKWSKVLTKHLDNDANNVPKAARRLQGNPTILVIDSYVPLYDRESGCVRLLNILKLLLNLGYSVIFFPDNGYPEQPYTSVLQQLGIEVIYGTPQRYNLEEKLIKYLPLIDGVWLCRPELCDKYMDLIRLKTKAPIIYDTIDLHFLRLKRQKDYLDPSYQNTSWSWETYQKLELNYANQAEATVVVTEDEKQVLSSLGVKNVWVIPNIHEEISLSEKVAFDQRSGLIFIGSYNHPPNIDAVKWLCLEIMPLVWASRPDITVNLLGSNLKDEVKELANDQVIVTGYVPEVEPYFQKSRIFVAPLRFGAGMKGKIGQSLSLGLPTITTRIGAEGMGLIDHQDVLIADTAEEFAQAVIELYDNRELWQKLADNSLETIKRYQPATVQTNLQALLSNLGIIAKDS